MITSVWRPGRAAGFALCLVVATASGIEAVEREKAGKDLSAVQRAKLDLAAGALTADDLSGIMAPSPPPTPEPPTTGTPTVRTSICGKPLASVSQVERSANSGLDAKHVSNPSVAFSFVYSDTDTYVFPKSAAAKQYVSDSETAMESCTSYFYGTATDERYIPQRGLAAPDAGDGAALLIATLVYPSGNSRDDVTSVVRVGQLVSFERLQVSEPLTAAQVTQMARSQARHLESILGVASKGARKSKKD